MGYKQATCGLGDVAARSLLFVPRPRASSSKLKETLIDRIEKKNGNPYNGMPLAFDFMFCRLGHGSYERDMNLKARGEGKINLAKELELVQREYCFASLENDFSPPVLFSLGTSMD